MRYAQGTEVSVGRSREQIESILTRYGADAFGYVTEGSQAVLQFKYEGRMIRFVLPLPDRDDPSFTETPTGRDRSEQQAFKAWEQATKQRWRALLLAIKAKLEVTESGIRTFDQEFGLDIVMPDGRTVAEHVMPGIQQALASGATPRLLPQFTGRD